MLKSDYNFYSKLLHKIALQTNGIAEISFDLDNILKKRSDKVFSDKHIFITGLARSGTTILLQYLYDTGLFTSLTYLNMPFVLMPRIWGKAVSTSSAERKERAHKDGIMIGLDSPEAFEEVFWRVFCGDRYIKNDLLKTHRINKSVLVKFKKYLENILSSDTDTAHTRYLSKNNNNILRLTDLQTAMPNAQFIIPFRDPLQHAISLLNQHIHFSKIQQQDKFSLNYMNWLGHFEFGLNQKSFLFNDTDLFERLKEYDKTDINFWLLNWKNYYQYANKISIDNLFFFNYEEFCRAPSAVMNKLFTETYINTTFADTHPFISPIKKAAAIDKDLLAECDAIFKQLAAKFTAWYVKPSA